MSKVIDETEVQGQVRMVTPSLPGYLLLPVPKTRTGVFTSRAISKGEVIEVCPMIVFSRKDRLYIDSTFLYEYYFE